MGNKKNENGFNEQDKELDENDDSEISHIALGICLGFGLGSAIGWIFNNMMEGICIGIGVGMLIGVLLDSGNDKK